VTVERGDITKKQIALDFGILYVDNKGEQEGKQVSMFYYHCEALINNSILHFFLCEPISPERYFFLISFYAFNYS
jgi:hypothetical protein